MRSLVRRRDLGQIVEQKLALGLADYSASIDHEASHLGPSRPRSAARENDTELVATHATPYECIASRARRQIVHLARRQR
jgi:hypothetical protein